MLKVIKTSVLLILILSTVFLDSGCWDALSLDQTDINIITMQDKTDKGYAFYAEVLDVKKGGSSGEQAQAGGNKNLTEVIKGVGKSLTEARSDLDRQLNKPIFLGAVQETIFTENFAKAGITEYIYRVRSNI
jgi:hypothetical protein